MMKYLERSIFIFTFTCLILNITVLDAIAQDTYSSYLNIESGLVNNEVTAIKQDKFGFIWFGTRGGLNKYDGYDLKLIRNAPNSRNNLTSQGIEVLFEGSNNCMWIGTKTGGLHKYDMLSDSISRYPLSNGADMKNILALYEATNGNLYVGAYDGFYILDKRTKQFKVISKWTKVYDIKPDDLNGLWLTTTVGLLHLDNKNNIISSNRFGFKSISLTSMAIDRVNTTIYLGSWEKGLIVFNYKTNEVKRYVNEPGNNKSLSNNNTFRLLLDKKGDLLVGTWGGGLNKFDLKTSTFSKFNLTLPGSYNNDNEVVLSLEQDHSGVVWLGTDGGVYTIDPNRKKFHNITYEAGNPFTLNKTHIVSIFIDSKNALWVGTKDGGLEYSQDHRAFKHVPLVANGRKVLRINSIFQNEDKLWAGTGSGLFIIDNLNPSGNIHAYFPDGKDDQHLSGGKVTSIIKDHRGVIWLGTQETGLNKLISFGANSTPLFKKYLPSPGKGSLQSERISCMYVDDKDRLWIGTYNGLHLYNRQTDDFTYYQHKIDVPGSISNSIILCISQDDNRNIWIGTQNGLNKMVENNGTISFQNYFATENFPSDYVHAILADHHSQIWVSTNKGITCINTQTNEFKNYDIRDGLASNAYSENAAFHSKDGTMFFGGIKGVTFFHPDSINVNHLLPRVYFTNLIINNQSVKVGEEVAGSVPLHKALFATNRITLTYKQDFISLSFAALDYHASDKNHYAYRLKGFDDRWINSGSRRNVTYTNFPPGTYTLQVIASNSDNVWNKKGAELQIKVLPPPWKSWWAYVIYISLFLYLLWLSRHIGVNRMKLKNNLERANETLKKEREIADIKSKLFTNISHEFRTPLTLMIGPLNDLERTANLQAGVKKTLVRVHDQAKRLLNLVNQLLEFEKAEANKVSVNTVEANLVAFTRENFNSFSNEAKRRNIDYRFKASNSEIVVDFDQEKMTIILYNLLSNAFKFSDNNSSISVVINLITTNDISQCELKIIDTGKGIGKKEQEKIFDRYYQIASSEVGKFAGTGIGLAFVKDLVLLHNGQIDVESEPGKGSTFRIILPARNATSGHDAALSIAYTSADENVEENETEEMAAEPIEKPIVLVVEDNYEVNEYIISILNNTYQTTAAINGAEGLEKAFEIVPDVIVSDVMMPHMDGFEFCKRIKKDQRTSHIPVILLTAQSDTSAELKGVREGADVYLSKPFNPQLLLSHIKNLIDLRKKLKELFKQRISLNPSEIEVTPFEEEFIKGTIATIEANLTNEQFQTDDLAAGVHMSRSTFYRKLKAITNMSGSEFIRYIRLKRSAQLLLTGEFSISQVAFEVGFNDVKHYRKCFQKQFNTTPSEYLKKEKAKELS